MLASSLQYEYVSMQMSLFRLQCQHSHWDLSCINLHRDPQVALQSPWHLFVALCHFRRRDETQSNMLVMPALIKDPDSLRCYWYVSLWLLPPLNSSGTPGSKVVFHCPLWLKVRSEVSSVAPVSTPSSDVTVYWHALMYKSLHQGEKLKPWRSAKTRLWAADKFLFN